MVPSESATVPRLGRSADNEPGAAAGVFTDRAGMAILHPFERVVPASQVGSQTADANARGGGSRTNVFNGPIIGSEDAILRAIDRRLAHGMGFSNAIDGTDY